MNPDRSESVIARRLIDSMYIEAMVLADEARAYFDDAGRADRDALAPITRVSFSCESLKVTTRLMHVIAWLLTQRAVMAGELRPHNALEPSRRLGLAPASVAASIEELPAAARVLVEASIDLHRRVARLDDAQAVAAPRASPARLMQERLALAL